MTLEELLNSLIQRGWKPRNIECTGVKSTDYCLEFYTELKTIGWISKDERQLTSKESGLWQFVCENKMEKKMEKNHRGIWINSWAKSAYEKYPVYTMERYEYRIIESALCDEDKLEDFLLNSIKLD